MISKSFIAFTIALGSFSSVGLGSANEDELQLSTHNTQLYSQIIVYSVKRNGEEIGHLIGTSHEDKIERSILHPKIKKISIEAKTIAFENVLTEERNRDVNAVSFYVRYDIQDAYNDFYKRHHHPQKVYQYPTTEIRWKKEEYTKENGTENLILKARGESFSEVIPLENALQHAQACACLEMSECYLDTQRLEGKVSDEEIESYNQDSYTAFQTGDEALIKKTYKWRKSQDPAHNFFIVKKRNHHFSITSVVLIQKANPENKILIGVGFSHFIGKNSFPNMIREKLGEDYTIEKISISSTI